MSKLPNQTQRKALIKRLHELGWEGPFSGTGDHPEFMTKGTEAVKIPNKHSKPRDIGIGLLKIVLTQANISKDEWLGTTKEATDNEQEQPDPDK